MEQLICPHCGADNAPVAGENPHTEGDAFLCRSCRSLLEIQAGVPVLLRHEEVYKAVIDVPPTYGTPLAKAEEVMQGASVSSVIDELGDGKTPKRKKPG